MTDDEPPPRCSCTVGTIYSSYTGMLLEAWTEHCANCFVRRTDWPERLQLELPLTATG